MRHLLKLAAVAVCLVAGPAGAADFTWDGGAYVSNNEATKNWDLAGNWDPDGLPAAGQTAVVATSSPYSVANVNLAGAPAIEVTVGGTVVHKAGVTVSTPVTLSGGTWSTGVNTSYGAGSTRVLNAPLTVTAPSFLTGVRGNLLQIKGVLSGDALLTLRAVDAYQGNGPDWEFTAPNSTFSGGILMEADRNPVLVAGANQALGTGDITVRATGLLRFAASQNYGGAARTPVIYLEGAPSPPPTISPIP